MERFDRSKIKSRSLAERRHKMTMVDVRSLKDPMPPFSDPELDGLVAEIVKARLNGRPVIAMMGAHPIRRGNSRYLIDLIERGVVTHLAVNGAVPIHDFELAYIGATTEDVQDYLVDGSFGNWTETSLFINQAAKRAALTGEGLGSAVCRLLDSRNLRHKNLSVLWAAFRNGITVTVHKGIGFDITDQHPSADYGDIGKASGDDFLKLAAAVGGLQGGVFLCLGSQVTGPEVYLKALAMARNAARQKGETVNGFTTGVFDIVDLGGWRENGSVDYRKEGTLQDPRYYFRPFKTILVRTVVEGGKSFYVRGDFAVTIPALWKLVVR